MRHMKRVKKLGKKAKHRRAMLRNLAQSLIKYERIQTTLPKAKALRRYIEKMITKARDFETLSRKAKEVGEDTPEGKELKIKALHKVRLVEKEIKDKYLLYKLFHDIGPRYINRPGGYTRIYKLAKFRAGDAAQMALIEFVEEKVEEIKEPKTQEETKTK